MADKKISELTELITPDGTEELVVNDGGVSKKIAMSNLMVGIDDNATSTAITIDASENVGIGATVPTAKLDVGGQTDTTPATFRGTIRVGEGTQLDVNKVGGIDLPIADGYGCKIQALSAAGSALAFANRHNSATWVERMRIDASGNLLVGTTSAIGGTAAFLHVINTNAGKNGIAVGNSTGSSATVAIRFLNSNGTVGSIITSGSATSYNTSSDYRLKENVVPMTGSIDRLKALNPSKFNFISEPLKVVDGFLAHEAQAVVPECVSGTKDAMTDMGNITDIDGLIIKENVEKPFEAVDGETWTKTGSVPDYQGIDQSKLVPLLVASLQEAVAKIEALEARVTALEV